MLPAEKASPPHPLEKKAPSGPHEKQCSGKVELESLSKMTGFPTDFIKKELALSGEEVSLEELRKSMLAFLDSAFECLGAAKRTKGK